MKGCVCVSLHSCACQMQSSANDVPSHALQFLLSLKVWLAVAQIWKVRRCGRRNVDRGAPRNCLVNSTSKRACLQMTRVCLAAGCSWIHPVCQASRRSVESLARARLSLFDILISGGEDAASSSGRTSCARDSLASSAVSDGSEEEVVGFDNFPGEPWKVTVLLQRTSSPSRVEQVLHLRPDHQRLRPCSRWRPLALWPEESGGVWEIKPGTLQGNTARFTALERTTKTPQGPFIGARTHPHSKHVHLNRLKQATLVGGRWRHQSVLVQMWRTVTASISLLRLDAKQACLSSSCVGCV